MPIGTARPSVATSEQNPTAGHFHRPSAIWPASFDPLDTWAPSRLALMCDSQARMPTVIASRSNESSAARPRKKLSYQTNIIRVNTS
jgi:hypothetical protein